LRFSIAHTSMFWKKGITGEDVLPVVDSFVTWVVGHEGIYIEAVALIRGDIRDRLEVKVEIRRKKEPCWERGEGLGGIC
jgi:hypothetical protein